MKIPQNAKKVFQGVIYSIFQWDQERFDGSTATYEMVSRPHSAMVIPTVGEKIILARQEQPLTSIYFSLLGGQINTDEEPLEAAKRELKEESGLESSDWELYKVFEPMHKFDWKMNLFFARNCQKTSDQKVDPGEKIELVEVNFDEFVEIIQSEKFWGKELTLHLFRLQKESKLDEFKSKLF